MDHPIDSMGDICPIPIIKIEKELKEAKISDRIILESDHSCSTSSVVNHFKTKYDYPAEIIKRDEGCMLALPIASGSIKTKTRQIHWALLVLIVFLLIVFYLRGFNREASLTTIFGFTFGYILQRSRFCFAAGFRDIFMIRNTAVSRAILVLIFLTVIGFFIIQTIKGGLLPENGIIYPLGLHTIVIGVIFLLAIRYERGTLKDISLISLKKIKVKSGLDALINMFLKGANWSYMLGAFALALTNILLFYLWGNPAGITSGLTHMAGWLSCRIGFAPCDWYYFENN